MSIDRSYLPRIRLMSILALVLVVSVSAQADDTWHNVYHSLKRFFTGKSGSTATVHHRRRHSDEDEKNTSSTEPSPSPGENEASPGASATPRVVILPATSPAPDTTPGTENPVRASEAAVTPESSPQIGAILRSLSGPTPAVQPSPAPAAGNATSN